MSSKWYNTSYNITKVPAEQVRNVSSWLIDHDISHIFNAKAKVFEFVRLDKFDIAEFKATFPKNIGKIKKCDAELQIRW